MTTKPSRSPVCHDDEENGFRTTHGLKNAVVVRRCALKFNYHYALLFLVALTNLVLVVLPTHCDQSAPKSPSSSSTATSTIEDSDYVNLNEILKHQQALTEECRRLERNRLLELKQALEAKQDKLGGQDVHQEPVGLRLPAVCLLLIGPPSVASSLLDSDKDATSQQNIRLDLVNWLYDYDDLVDELQQAEKLATNKTKRQTAGNKDRAFSFDLVDGQVTSSIAGDQPWFSPSSSSNEIDNDSPDEKQFRAQLEKMIADDRFQEAIRQDQARISALLSPVILVPGLAGSRLQARISKTNRVNIICKKQHDWQELWLSVRSFLPIAIDCWIDNVRLEFDMVSGFTKEPAGVESRVPDFGSVESVRHLDLKSPKLTKYFDAIIERYIKIGYQADKNLFAAPYDFRLAPQQLQTALFEPLRQLIERAATGHLPQVGGPASWWPMSSGNELGRAGDTTTSGDSSLAAKRVTLVCHSMGCTHLLVFLRQQSAAWRQAHIRKVVALSSPWGGAVKALKALVVGEQFNLPIVSELKMRELTRTFPSVAYLLPQAEVYSRPTSQQADFGGPVLVQTPQRHYRVDQLEELLHELGLEQQWQWYQKSASLIRPMEPLDDVPMDCLHGLNVPTVETVLFRNQTDFPDGDYELLNGNGDGTVNHQSLLVCADWASKLPHLIRHRIIPNITHTGVLSHAQVLEYITEDAATN
uniref:Group XV phospholipase A2 n=1 Tax=Aceria tosichella TaxID=561515 RepID=A0A6G1S892_9ACAR